MAEVCSSSSLSSSSSHRQVVAEEYRSSEGEAGLWFGIPCEASARSREADSIKYVIGLTGLAEAFRHIRSLRRTMVTAMEELRDDRATIRGRLLEAREREREAETARARIAADYEILKDRVLKKRREQQWQAQQATPARTGSAFASLDDIVSLGDPSVVRGGLQRPEALTASRPPLPDRRREREEEEVSSSRRQRPAEGERREEL
ncbi:hypothetical protein Taro_025103 [Colocasia esculenta]|uniref:Uncharacterized protein n=1 Tax=Colocasia esculenta TaxID=4460 RepID=A0A843V814_COLES|nr:hypothetical protein [Colocasia esculenta]